MSKKEHVSATPATMWLKQHKVPFEDGIYEYVEHGGTAQAAACFGVCLLYTSPSPRDA